MQAWKALREADVKVQGSLEMVDGRKVVLSLAEGLNLEMTPHAQPGAKFSHVVSLGARCLQGQNSTGGPQKLAEKSTTPPSRWPS